MLTHHRLGCLELQIGDQQRARLEQASQVELGFPHDFLTMPYVQQLINGSGEIDNHRA